MVEKRARMSQRAKTEGSISFRRKREERRPVKAMMGGVVLRVELGVPLGPACRRR